MNDAPQSWAVRKDIVKLWLRNHFDRARATDAESDVVVTMTTHGSRIKRVHVALESIARGERKPRRLILWLDQPNVTIPRSLRRLRRRGVEIVQVEPGMKVHTKYFPYVASIDEHQLALVTSDDDIVYPGNWLAQLEEAVPHHPNAVVVHRAHRIMLDENGIAPYLTWPPVFTMEPSYLNFGTSVSGQYFPAALLDKIRDEGTAFLDKAGTADDIWLHRIAVANGYPTVQIHPQPHHYPFVPGTQASGLYQVNVLSGENDAQVQRTYTADDIAALRSAG